MNKKTRVFILLTLIILLGFFLRLVNINNAPPGIYPDEGVNGEDALRAVNFGEWKWFYTANNGREGLFINLIATFFKFFGVSFLTLKLPSIIFGTLTIWGIYLLSKELFKKDRLALISAFLVSVSFWSINFSRISFRAIMLPAILVFSSYFLWKGVHNKKTWPFIAGGFIFGIGLHTCIAFRIAPLILFLTLLFLIWEKRKFLKVFWKKIIIFLLFSFISASPMFFTFYSHPEYLESRSADVSVLSPEVNQGKPAITFLRSLSLSLVKYNFWGDQNWRHNYPPYPILNPIVGFTFLVGIVYFVIKFFSQLCQKIFSKKEDTDLALSGFLLSWFALMLAPEFMTAEGLPHALRSIGTLPIVYILAAFGFVLILEKARKISNFFHKFVLSLMLASLIFVGTFNSMKYHFFWAKKVETANSFEKNLINISNYIQSAPLEEEIFIITGSMQRVPIKLLNNSREKIKYFYPNETDQINPKNENNFKIIMTENNQEQINFLENKLGPFKFIEQRDEKGIVFYALEK